MNGSRFDRWTRDCLTPSSRRQAVGALLLGLSMSPFAFLDGEARKRKRRKKKCKGGKKKCGKKCISKANCCTSSECPDTFVCEGGACVCSDEDFPCEETCNNLATDGANCGACGVDCISGGCVHGACTCGSENECSQACTCSARLDGGGACRFGVSSTPCTSDDDCPLLSFCLAGNNTCSEPCIF
jgi:hypothetical protein